MPVKAPRICACGRRVPAHVMCDCERRRAAERNARADARRPNAAQRGYNGKWQKERVAFLKLNPVCRRCGAPAVIVNHVIPHKGDLKLFWRRGNWEPACKPCHDGPIQAEERRADRVEP